MQMEQYEDHRAFCQTAAYQQWRRQWRVPGGIYPPVERWSDCERNLHVGMIPRQAFLTRTATRLPFYLLDSLEIGDLACVDIGCGTNWFRQFYPSIWGVDPHHETHRDELLTPEWWIPNWGRWDRAFSCNALHFGDPIWVAQNISKVQGLLRPGGRAMVALNRARIQEHTAAYSDTVLQETLLGCPGLTRMVWFQSPPDAGMDGNVWLWIRAELP